MKRHTLDEGHTFESGEDSLVDLLCVQYDGSRGV